MNRGWSWLATVALGCAACGLNSMFICQTSSDCGQDGVCEANGGCSFPDPTCDSGRRFAAHVPSAHECVPVADASSTSEGGGPQTTSGFEPSTTTGVPQSDETTSPIVESSSTSSTSTGSSSGDVSSGSTGGSTNLLFEDDFERRDSPDVGNGWVEKNPDSFALVAGGIRRVGPALNYQRNQVYRPDGHWLDVEAVLEFMWFDLSGDHGSPQCALRAQLDDIDAENSISGYLLFVPGDGEHLVISRQLGGSFTQEYEVPLPAVEVGVPYRLRFQVSGTKTVQLDGFLERLDGGVWTVHAEVHGQDEDEQRIAAPGTLSLSGHTQTELWSYDSVTLHSL